MAQPTSEIRVLVDADMTPIRRKVKTIKREVKALDQELARLEERLGTFRGRLREYGIELEIGDDE